MLACAGTPARGARENKVRVKRKTMVRPMLTHPTYDRLIALGLTGMAKALEEQRRQPDVGALTFEERLGLLVDREAVERESRRLVTRLESANLRRNATIEDLDTKAVRGLDVMAEPCPARTRCSPSSRPANGSCAGRTC